MPSSALSLSKGIRPRLNAVAVQESSLALRHRGQAPGHRKRAGQAAVGAVTDEASGEIGSSATDRSTGSLAIGLVNARGKPQPASDSCIATIAEAQALVTGHISPQPEKGVWTDSVTY